VQKICRTHKKGRARRNTPQMPCFGEDDLDTEDVESDTESELWSAQDESDE